jgi:hypothetical protein
MQKNLAQERLITQEEQLGFEIGLLGRRHPTLQQGTN